MSDDARANRDANVADTIERIRAERFPEVDRDLVLTILSLHADGVVSENASRTIEEAIAQHAGEAG